MPSTYAHYRFGVQVLPTLPADTRRTIGRFRRMFDVGLHGPDLFFYYLPVTNTGISLGRKFHRQSGKDFFQRVCRMTRLEGSEAAQSYLYGLLCHYALDSACHPFVCSESQEDPSLHVRMESEFDRFLLEADGKAPACSQDLSHHIQLTPGECETVAKFYPGATVRGIRTGVRNMALVTKVLSKPEGARRNVLQNGLRVLSRNLPDMMVPAAPVPGFGRYNEKLMKLYDQAISDFPGLLYQIQASLTYNATLDDAFAPNFG